jgi:hypothetical protein
MVSYRRTGRLGWFMCCRLLCTHRKPAPAPFFSTYYTSTCFHQLVHMIYKLVFWVLFYDDYSFWHLSRCPLMGRLPFSKNPFARTRISAPFKEPRNRFTALRVGTTTLLAGPPSSIGVRNRSSKSIPGLPKRYKYGLSRFYLKHFEVFISSISRIF